MILARLTLSAPRRSPACQVLDSLSLSVNGFRSNSKRLIAGHRTEPALRHRWKSDPLAGANLHEAAILREVREGLPAMTAELFAGLLSHLVVHFVSEKSVPNPNLHPLDAQGGLDR